MAAIPSRVSDRLVTGLKRFQPILTAARARDVNEADTSRIVTDLLAEVFGYDKYTEITGEHAIRGSYCDLAVKIEGKLQLLVEVKAIGLDLRDAHVKQAVDYAANQGVEWVALTNGSTWKVFRVVFAKPIDQELVLEVDLLELNPRTSAHIESLYLLTRESLIKSGLAGYHVQRQATNRFFLGALVLSDPVLAMIRRELKRVSPGVKVELDDIRTALIDEVLKREVVDGEKAAEARKKVQRALGRTLRARHEKGAPAETRSDGQPTGQSPVAASEQRQDDTEDEVA